MKFEQIVQDYSVKYSNWMKKVTSHLEIIGIDVFTYFNVSNDGSYLTISNYPEQQETFYKEKNHFACPFFTNPDFFRSGAIITRSVQDPFYQESLDIAKDKFAVNDPLILMQKTPKGTDGYFFAYKNKQKVVNYFDYMGALQNFACYYKHAVHEKFGTLETDYNIKKELGEIFDQLPQGVNLTSRSKEREFIKSIFQLTERECDCYLLVRQGYSSSEVGEMLKISKRTVEHHLEEIKSKTKSESKSDLIKKWYSL